MVSKSRKMTTFQAEVEKVAKILSKEIYAGHRLPHQHLIENKLAETYSVSRMIIRQVLSRLESIGLVEIEPYKGATVAAITIDRIRETYQIVAMLEGFAAKLAAAHITSEDIRSLEEILIRQKRLEEGKTEAWQLLNKEFHKIVNRRCGNDRLIQLIGQHVQFTNYWFLVLAVPGFDRNIEDHEKILGALKDGDGGNAREHMERHITTVCDYLIEHIGTNVPAGMLRPV
ncbi:MAG: GntR family transcriptional regulator [Proteobacteria bacterium]|nr:GntR family transcriptional regulator [Pseudomonadota bacterium]